MTEFAQQYSIYDRQFQLALVSNVGKMRYQPCILSDSMRYSLLPNSKHIRPILFFATLDAYGYDYAEEPELALALEYIHTYSLIHDDLPAMDNDDYRRGQPSNHKAFGEGYAILAGDALLTYAFELALSTCARSARHIEAASELARAAGPDGMIAGQAADLFYAHGAPDEKKLDYVYRNKTGKLLVAPIVMAGILACGEVKKLRKFGEALGYLFQLTDDLLDVKGNENRLGKKTGQDEKEDKLTCIKVFGLEKSEEMAAECAKKCHEHLNEIQGIDAVFLHNLVDFVLNRDH